MQAISYAPKADPRADAELSARWRERSSIIPKPALL
jgi:hypothetical protein